MKKLITSLFFIVGFVLFSQELAEVKVSSLKITENFDSYYYGGRLEANLIVKQYSPISGIVTSISYKEGDFVTKNSTILSIQKKSSGGIVYNPYEVKAIYDGLIIKNSLVEGEEVFEKSEILNLADISKYKLKLFVSDKDIPYIKIGDSCFMKENKSISGTVSKVGIIPDVKTGLFEVELLFLRQKELFIGKYLTVEIRANYNRSITVGFNEVINKYGKTFLFILEGDVVTLREIKLGRNWGDRVTIESGVKPDEKYVTYSSRLLNDKDRVVVQKSDSKSDKTGKEVNRQKQGN